MDEDNRTSQAPAGEHSLLSLGKSDKRQRKSLRSPPNQLSDKTRSVVRKSFSGKYRIVAILFCISLDMNIN